MAGPRRTAPGRQRTTEGPGTGTMLDGGQRCSPVRLIVDSKNIEGTSTMNIGEAHDELPAAEQARQNRERSLQQRATNRLRYLIAAVVVLGAAVAGLLQGG